MTANEFQKKVKEKIKQLKKTYPDKTDNELKGKAIGDIQKELSILKQEE